ncbi:MAG: glycosyltransferase 87 family protein [Jatrophihabitantaceae bacterium]
MTADLTAAQRDDVTTASPLRSPADGVRPSRWSMTHAQASERSAILLTLLWLGSRALTAATLYVSAMAATGDAKYYFSSLSGLTHGGTLATTFREYPVPVLSVLYPQFAISGNNEQRYLILFCLSMMVVDAFLTAILWRRCGRRIGTAVVFWLVFVPLLGNIAYFRFDLIPGVLVALAILFLAKRPALAAAATAIAAAFKLWPAVLIAVLALSGRRRRIIGAFLATGVGAALLSIVTAGFTRTISPLSWQKDRGLQMESIAATPLMLARRFGPDKLWQVHQSQFTAVEIFGPGVHTAIRITSLLSIVGALVLAWLWFRTRNLGTVPIDLLATLILATILLMVLANKTLSPQYLIWIGAPIAALLALNPNQFVRRAAWTMLLVAALTQYEFPYDYPDIVAGTDGYGLGVLALSLRNALLCWLAYDTCREIFRRTRRPVLVSFGAALPIS